MYTNTQRYWKCEKYANFLDQPLELEMFVPCVDGVPIEKPKRYNERYFGDWGLSNWSKDNHAYKQAKERVLFEGFIFETFEQYDRVRFNNETIAILYGTWSFLSNEVIEDLAKLKPTLTETALKQINL